MKHMDHISIEDIRKLSDDHYKGLLNYFKICGYVTTIKIVGADPIYGFIWLNDRLILLSPLSDGYPILSFNEVVEMAMMGMIAS